MGILAIIILLLVIIFLLTVIIFLILPKPWNYIGFFALLVIGFYIILINVIPGFSKSKLPPISYVQPFSFTNQDGKIVTQKDVTGKVYLANYFFTTCKSICP